jgi:hypothetical protein
MFITELAPVLQKLIQQPMAFTGGFVSGLLQLKLNEEPLSKWLAEQGYTTSNTNTGASRNGSDKPQSISID